MSNPAQYPDWFEAIAHSRVGWPALVLEVWPGPNGIQGSPKIFGGRPWMRIQHQTAGVCCHQRVFWATRLAPKDGALTGMQKIEARWFGTNLGRGPWLSAVAEYEASIRNLFGDDVTCNRSYDLLEEGIYPIDLTRNALARLTVDALSDFPNDAHAIASHLWIFDQGGTLRLPILGANSD